MSVSLSSAKRAYPQAKTLARLKARDLLHWSNSNASAEDYNTLSSGVMVINVKIHVIEIASLR
jgi:hypothetical protein